MAAQSVSVTKNVSVPQVIQFAYDNYSISGDKRLAKCKFCTAETVTITDSSPIDSI